MCLQVNTLQRSFVKNNYCKERIEAKVGGCIHVFINNNYITKYYCRLIVNNKYIQYVMLNPTVIKLLYLEYIVY